MRKLLVTGIIFLLAGFMITPSTGINLVRELTVTSIDGNTLYVGGSGPNNYTKIQDAIDDATDGDTVYVYNDSSPYYERLIIEKSINLIGEDKQSTIIHYISSYPDGIIFVRAEWVTIHGFTLQGIGTIMVYPGIKITSNHTNIHGNNIDNVRHGIYIEKAYNNTISKNTITSCDYYGMLITYSNGNIITENNIIDSYPSPGIFLYKSNKNFISRNNFYNNSEGIKLAYSNDNIISINTFNSNDYGIFAGSSTAPTYNNRIFHNNFINNNDNCYDLFIDYWDNLYPSGGNYWDDYIGPDADGDGIGDISYPIPGSDNEDRYPLMEPFGFTELTVEINFGPLNNSIIIKNIGDTPALKVQWEMSIDKGLVIRGRESSGVVPKPLIPIKETTVSPSGFLGFGLIKITISVWADNAPIVTETIPGFLFLFFIIVK